MIESKLKEHFNQEVPYLSLYHSIGKIWEDYHILIMFIGISYHFDIDKLHHAIILIAKETEDDDKHIDSFLYDYIKTNVVNFEIEDIDIKIRPTGLQIELYSEYALNQMENLFKDLKSQLNLRFDKKKIHHSSGPE